MPLDLLNWASKNMCDIDFIYISAEEITEHCQGNNLNERYDPHEKINRWLTDINRCLTDIFKIKPILTDI